jgi:hypothetical protein
MRMAGVVALVLVLALTVGGCAILDVVKAQHAVENPGAPPLTTAGAYLNLGEMVVDNPGTSLLAALVPGLGTVVLVLRRLVKSLKLQRDSLIGALNTVKKEVKTKRLTPAGVAEIAAAAARLAGVANELNARYHELKNGKK